MRRQRRRAMPGRTKGARTEERHAVAAGGGQSFPSSAARTNAFRSTFCSTEIAMHHFAYRGGVLHAEAVSVAEMAGRGHAILLLFQSDD